MSRILPGKRQSETVALQPAGLAEKALMNVETRLGCCRKTEFAGSNHSPTTAAVVHGVKDSAMHVRSLYSKMYACPAHEVLEEGHGFVCVKPSFQPLPVKTAEAV